MGEPAGQRIDVTVGPLQAGDLIGDPVGRQAAALGDQYRCVLLTLPNFGEQSVKPGGFDFTVAGTVLREPDRMEAQLGEPRYWAP